MFYYSLLACSCIVYSSLAWSSPYMIMVSMVCYGMRFYSMLESESQPSPARSQKAKHPRTGASDPIRQDVEASRRDKERSDVFLKCFRCT